MIYYFPLMECPAFLLFHCFGYYKKKKVTLQYNSTQLLIQLYFQDRLFNVRTALKSDKTKLINSYTQSGLWNVTVHNAASALLLMTQSMALVCVSPSPSSSWGLCSLIKGAVLGYDLNLLILFTMILYTKFYHPCVITSAIHTQQAQEHSSWEVNSFVHSDPEQGYKPCSEQPSAS